MVICSEGRGRREKWERGEKGERRWEEGEVGEEGERRGGEKGEEGERRGEEASLKGGLETRFDSKFIKTRQYNEIHVSCSLSCPVCSRKETSWPRPTATCGGRLPT